MTIEKVYSPVEDKKIRENLNDSPIWKISYHITDLEDAKKKHPVLYEYQIKFDGLKPVMVTKVSKITK